MERAAAREQIWTPDKGDEDDDGTEPETAEKPGELWTPARASAPEPRGLPAEAS